MKLFKTPLRIAVFVSGTVIAITLSGLFLLSTTGLGQRWVLDRLLTEVNSSVNGRVLVGSVNADWMNNSAILSLSRL